jgi:hypothetical protein
MPGKSICTGSRFPVVALENDRVPVSIMDHKTFARHHLASEVFQKKGHACANPIGSLCVWLSQLCPNLRSDLLVVRPETVIRRHRQGFGLYC